MSETRRPSRIVNFQADPQVAARIDRLLQITEIKTKSELIRAALRHYEASLVQELCKN